MSEIKQIVIIDNHDSFTYNLVQLFDENEHCNITVIPHDEVVLESLDKFDMLVLSPGPDVPRSYPILFRILDRYKADKPILGVCLGHQTIGEYFGATLENLSYVYHGQSTTLYYRTEDVLFATIDTPVSVGLYHSWALSTTDFPEELEIVALSDEGVIMSIRHKVYNIKGVQFHPESYITSHGREIINNWVLSL
ncbi:aminodeoxychorismate/anthranilate synthase component II [Myroides odoratimimus]|uniref:anthranilate synthase component II n=1 Tax=Myroides odoratimimus TaxID=76832 RepID=UPI00103F34F6|nr:aminodeoxychorismate/anthranilate synthase component II [Myroides odoratimimus]MDM1410408.1 aminodeoxychorismate/anthranilate synthase component II [Myroides odoratimimus]MDM1496976.1 aminodeoxychorismate/anthranilate synthase component II [Myroides odoratimimus]QBK77949.1 aminodeoxychorismate/anthranilate synthase component II [Myroides odoratimimus]WHT73413.1 aminodeoxychorismate/anthranilate synthase component II [Myroides odoratimimus]WHU37995.1 aminodeoxychorismate/anthranilate synthas